MRQVEQGEVVHVEGRVREVVPRRWRSWGGAQKAKEVVQVGLRSVVQLGRRSVVQLGLRSVVPRCWQSGGRAQLAKGVLQVVHGSGGLVQLGLWSVVA